MQTKLMKSIAVSALLITALFWGYVSNYQLALRFVVSLAAFLVARQAVRADRLVWAAGFFTIALLFNPFLPVIAFSGSASFLTVLASAAAFAVSLAALKTKPLLSIPSITDRVPGSESL